jgi:hypothetical protein
MDEKEVNESENIDNNHEENRDLILKLDKQVALGLWIQVIGQVIESTALSQLLVLNGDPSDPNLINKQNQGDFTFLFYNKYSLFLISYVELSFSLNLR